MEKISFKHLDGWLKFLVVINWIQVGFAALTIAAFLGIIVGTISQI